MLRIRFPQQCFKGSDAAMPPSAPGSTPTATARDVPAAAVGNGGLTHERRVIGQVDTPPRDVLIDPDRRVARVLHDSPDPQCDGGGSGMDDRD